MSKLTDSCYAETRNRKWIVTLLDDRAQVVRVLYVKARWGTKARRYAEWHVAMHKLEVSTIRVEREAS